MGQMILESIIFIFRYKAGPQGPLLNPKGGASFLITGERKSIRPLETAILARKVYY